MVRRSYVGLADAANEFEELAPLVAKLRALQRRCRPFGRDYLAIAISLDALDTTAYHFTRRPGFFGARHDSAGSIAGGGQEPPRDESTAAPPKA